MTTDDDPEQLDQFRSLEFASDDGPITIIQDTENEDAWIQSDVATDVNR